MPGIGEKMSRPNILLIIADQHRYDCIAYSGKNKNNIKTDNIDRLASRGVWFNNAYTPHPVCCPARQALIAGRRAETFGANWNDSISMQVASLKPDDFSYAKLLNQGGYSTTYAGIWDGGKKFGPTSFGFEKHIPYVRTYGAKTKEGEVFDLPFEKSDTYTLADKVVKEMDLLYKKDEPWHMSVNFHEPHPYYSPLKEFYELYKDKEIKSWDGFYDDLKDKPYIQRQQILNWRNEGKGWEDFWEDITRKYHALVSQLDRAVGLILDNIDDNTIVIYTSDHGDTCGSHGMYDKHYIMYEDVIHVPLIISWPKAFKEALRTDAYVTHFLDLGPTILSLANVGIPEDAILSGYDLSPILKGEADTSKRNEVVASYNGQQFGLYCQRAIKTDKWKYVWNATDIDELYDLEEDPGELTNLIYKADIGILESLRRRLYEILVKDKDPLINNWVKDQFLENRKI